MSIIGNIGGQSGGVSLTKSIVIVTAPAGSSVTVVSAGGYARTKALNTKNLLDIDAYKAKVGNQAINGAVSWAEDGLWLQATYTDCYTEYGPTFFTIPAKPNTKYTMSWHLTGSGNPTGLIYAFVYSGDSQIASYHAVNTDEKLTFITPSGATSFGFRFGVQESGQNAFYSNIQIEEGEKTDYVRYSSCRFDNVPNGWMLVTALRGEQKAEASIFMGRKGIYYFSLQYRIIPQFIFSGTYALVDDNNNSIPNPDSWNANWKIRFLTSGVFRITAMCNFKGHIDLFAAGAGASGSKGQSGECEGSGGGAGYTVNRFGLALQENTDYQIVIGAGGLAENTTSGTNGGTTSAFGVSVGGGLGGSTANYKGIGGNGGSGAGAWGGRGGTDGGDGLAGDNGTPGKGQNSTTREFETGKLYCSGGHGGGTVPSVVHASPNTGDGGSGAPSYANGPGANGGAGIVVIRNAR